MKNTKKVYKYLKYTLAAELFCMWMLGTIFKVKMMQIPKQKKYCTRQAFG